MASKNDIKTWIKEEFSKLGLDSFIEKEDIFVDEAKKEIRHIGDFVKKHPFISTFGALFVGFQLGKFFKK